MTNRFFSRQPITDYSDREHVISIMSDGHSYAAAIVAKLYDLEQHLETIEILDDMNARGTVIARILHEFYETDLDRMIELLPDQAEEIARAMNSAAQQGDEPIVYGGFTKARIPLIDNDHARTIVMREMETMGLSCAGYNASAVNLVQRALAEKRTLLAAR